MNTILIFIRQADKQRHLDICFGLTMMIGYLLTMLLSLPVAVGYSSCAVLVVGFGKEWYDYKHPNKHTADVMDFLADVIGVACAALVLLVPLIVKAVTR